jgi:dolichol kinase
MFELKRKAIHFIGLSVPVLYWLTSREFTLCLVGIAVVCALCIEGARLKWEKANNLVFTIVGGYTRNHEQKRVTGATYYAVASFLVILLFSERVAISSLLFLTLGDSAAALVGTRYGRHKIFQKSVEGSTACFLVCSLVGFFMLGWIGVVGALAATIIELLPIPVDDNLRIPLVSGGLMQVVLLFMG